uniref:Uncharacterized protein n=3 Tax=Anguilla TaxID=7935 RepID=A0A0E9TK69_ANGAN
METVERLEQLRNCSPLLEHLQ